MKDAFFEIFGWYGVIAVLAAYGLVSLGVIAPWSLASLILNTTGGCALAIISYRKKAYQPVIINIVWFVIAVAAFLKH